MRFFIVFPDDKKVFKGTYVLPDMSNMPRLQLFDIEGFIGFLDKVVAKDNGEIEAGTFSARDGPPRATEFSRREYRVQSQLYGVLPLTHFFTNGFLSTFGVDSESHFGDLIVHTGYATRVTNTYFEAVELRTKRSLVGKGEVLLPARARIRVCGYRDESTEPQILRTDSAPRRYLVGRKQTDFRESIPTDWFLTKTPAHRLR